jgi:methionyl aminopeptidase
MKTKEGYDLYSKEEVDILREGGAILRSILEFVSYEVKVGVKSIDIDRLAEKMVEGAGATAIFKNYTPKGARRPYPASICISVNDEVAHGIPGDYVFKSGDIVSLDLGLRYMGLVVDSAVTVSVGAVTDRGSELINVTREALEVGIREVRDGAYTRDIGRAIEKYAKSKGYKVIDTLWGHAVGHNIHADPGIPHTDIGKKGDRLTEGMVIAIEPHITTGKSTDIKLMSDGYTLKTKDLGKTAQFEHTVYVGKDKGEILT